nr:MAG TPA: hypothetical protein [Siphoviridae sp. cthRu26]
MLLRRLPVSTGHSFLAYPSATSPHFSSPRARAASRAESTSSLWSSKMIFIF